MNEFCVLTAPAGAEVEPSPVVLAARAVVVEHAARRRRGLQEKVECKLRSFPCAEMRPSMFASHSNALDFYPDVLPI